MKTFELASTDAIDALAPQVDEILRAIAVICDEPEFANALVTDESYFSDFGLEVGDYATLSAKLGIEIDPASADDRYIYRVAAKLKTKGDA